MKMYDRNSLHLFKRFSPKLNSAIVPKEMSWQTENKINGKEYEELFAPFFKDFLPIRKNKEKLEKLTAKEEKLLIAKNSCFSTRILRK